MKRLEGAMSSDGIAELEVIECDCGYHMGIDGSFVIQDDHAFMSPTRCPSCKATIPVRELLEMDEATFHVEVVRTASARRTITVRAKDADEAQMKALDEAGDYEFSEKDAEYETDGWSYEPS